jgi:hypothetical protein
MAAVAWSAADVKSIQVIVIKVITGLGVSLVEKCWNSISAVMMIVS